MTQAASSGGVFAATVIDASRGTVIARATLGRDLISAGATWSQNGRDLILSANDRRLVWNPGIGQPGPLMGASGIPDAVAQDVMVAGGGMLLDAGRGATSIKRFDLEG